MTSLSTRYNSLVHYLNHPAPTTLPAHPEPFWNYAHPGVPYTVHVFNDYVEKLTVVQRRVMLSVFFDALYPRVDVTEYDVKGTTDPLPNPVYEYLACLSRAIKETFSSHKPLPTPPYAPDVQESYEMLVALAPDVGFDHDNSERALRHDLYQTLLAIFRAVMFNSYEYVISVTGLAAIYAAYTLLDYTYIDSSRYRIPDPDTVYGRPGRFIEVPIIRNPSPQHVHEFIVCALNQFTRRLAIHDPESI